MLSNPPSENCSFTRLFETHSRSSGRRDRRICHRRPERRAERPGRRRGRRRKRRDPVERGTTARRLVGQAERVFDRVGQDSRPARRPRSAGAFLRTELVVVFSIVHSTRHPSTDTKIADFPFSTLHWNFGWSWKHANGGVLAIHYGWDNVKWSWRVKRRPWCQLTRSSRKPQSSPSKSELFSQKMHLKIPLLGRGLKLSNPKRGCSVSAFHVLCEMDTTESPMTLWQQAHSDKCFFLLLIPGLTLVSPLKIELVFAIVAQLLTQENDRLHICSL